MIAKDIINAAIAQGACGKAFQMAEKVNSWEDLASALFKPQSREYCALHNFPSLEMFKDTSTELRKYGVFFDAGEIESENPVNFAVVGNTIANITYSGTDALHRLIVMHGAKARVRATNYAVVVVLKIGEGCEVEFDNDETAKIL